MNGFRCLPLLVALMALLSFGGCQTRDSSEGMDVSPAAKIVFVPRVRRAIVQAALDLQDKTEQYNAAMIE